MSSPDPAAAYTVGRADYGVSVQAVVRLVPDVRLGQPAPNSTEPITIESVIKWIEAVSARAKMRLTHLSRISDRARVLLVNEALTSAVADGAASFLAAARFPARAGVNDSNYAAVLWARYEAAIAEIVATVDGWLDEAGTVAPVIPDRERPSWAFPRPQFRDGVRW